MSSTILEQSNIDMRRLFFGQSGITGITSIFKKSEECIKKFNEYIIKVTKFGNDSENKDVLSELASLSLAKVITTRRLRSRRGEIEQMDNKDFEEFDYEKELNETERYKHIRKCASFIQTSLRRKSFTYALDLMSYIEPYVDPNKVFDILSEMDISTILCDTGDSINHPGYGSTFNKLIAYISLDPDLFSRVTYCINCMTKSTDFINTA